jgi:hypothetical protein
VRMCELLNFNLKFWNVLDANEFAFKWKRELWKKNSWTRERKKMCANPLNYSSLATLPSHSRTAWGKNYSECKLPLWFSSCILRTSSVSIIESLNCCSRQEEEDFCQCLVSTIISKHHNFLRLDHNQV